MVKEAKTPKPGIKIEWYCLAVHKNIPNRTLEYAGVKKQIDQALLLYKTTHQHSLPTEWACASRGGEQHRHYPLFALKS